MQNPENPLWQASASIEALHHRAQFMQQLRDFFHARQVLEVETPILSRTGNTDPAIESFRADFHAAGNAASSPLYLHTSPEFFMKRLIAAGSGPIFQICKVFRDGEVGRLHNPEFSMLEWYRPGYTMRRLMDELDQLLRTVAGTTSSEIFTYNEIFAQIAALDIRQACASDYRACLKRHGTDEVVGVDDADLDAWRDLVMTHVIEPRLGQDMPVFICEYPVSQASFAKIVENEKEKMLVAQRFELYWRGIELANGYEELSDAEEQEKRFNAQNEVRDKNRQGVIPLDQHFLDALRAGLEPCSGVALGLDRLFMAIRGERTLSAVVAFPFERV